MLSNLKSHAECSIVDGSLANAVFNDAVESIVVCDLRGRIIHANRAAVELAGAPPDGRLVQDVFLFGFDSGSDPVSVVRSGGVVAGMPICMPREDGDRNLVVSAKLLSGIPEDRFVMTLLDSTDLAQSEQRIRELNANLERRVEERTRLLTAANRELEGFTYSVSHDLRGPLRSILAAVMILREDYGEAFPEGSEHELAKLTSATRKLSDLLDDLLRFSRLGRQQMNVVDSDLSALARDVVSDFAMRGEVRADQFAIQSGLRGEVDPKLFMLVLENLFGNSIKFARLDVPLQVQFGSHVEDGQTEYYVQDNGIGFLPEYAEKIFIPFERLHVERDYAGSGIGLANVQRILARHGGRVWADGKPGEGARFSFTLAEVPLQA